MATTTTGQITITDLNDGYTLSITGGNRTFSYASTGITPTPSSAGTFGFTLFRGGQSITPSTYDWSATGVLSGTSTTSTFQPTLSNNYSVAVPTTVTLIVTHEGNSLTTSVPVLITQVPSNAIINTIFVSAPAIYKDAVDAATAGTYSQVTIQGKRYDGSTNTNFGWITTTPNTTGVESARIDTSVTPLTLAPTPDSGVSSYTIKLYTASTGGTAVTSQTLNVTFKGAAGVSPVLYELGLSASVLARNSNNTLTPTNITVSAYSTTAGIKSAYSGRFKIYEDGVLKYSSDTTVPPANQSSHPYTPTTSTVGVLKFELYAAGGTTTLLDTQEVPIVVAGSDGLTISVPNSTHQIPSSSSGDVITYANSGTSIQVYEGDTPLTYTTTGSAYLATAYVKNSAGSNTTATKQIILSPSRSTTDSTVYYIHTNTPVITKTSSVAEIAGVHSTTSIQGKRIVSGVTTNYGWITITGNDELEAATAVDTATTALSFTPVNSAGRTSYTIRMYNQATVAGAVLLDSTVVDVVFAGVTGSRSAVLELYRWSSTPPTTFPTGTSTFTWSNNSFTLPATPNSWTLTPGTGAAGQTLYVTRQLYSDSLSTSTSTVTWATSLASLDTTTLVTGRTAVLELYQWAVSAPTSFPVGNSTYTWATGSFTNPATLNGWSLQPGTTQPGRILYACSTIYSDTLSAATTVILWNTAVAYVVGAANAFKVAYLRNNIIIPVNSAGTATWTGSGGALQVYEGTTALTLSSVTQSTTTPTTNQQYVLDITQVSGSTLTEPTITGALSTTATVGTWAGTLASITTTPRVFTIGVPFLSRANGIVVGSSSGAGTPVATISDHSLMSRDIDSVTINYPITYNRANGARATQIATQTISKLKGGATGAAGPGGIRGSRQLYSTDVAYTSSYDFDAGGPITSGTNSYAAKATQLIAAATAGSTPTTPINGDTVTFTNGSVVEGQAYVYTIAYNGSSWQPPGTVFDGSLLVTGSVTASKINSNGLDVRDTNGNIILSAGNSAGIASLTANANLVRGFGSWTNNGTNSVAQNQTVPENGTALVIASGSNLVSSDSPAMNLGSGTYTVSFKAYAPTGTSRTLYVDLFPDTLPESTVVVTPGWNNYQFTWTSSSSNLSNCYLRFFAAAQTGQIEIGDVKLEIGNKRTPWVPHRLDQPSVNNKISSLNASTYIADAAIGNAQIGNIIQSTNFNGAVNNTTGTITDTGSVGWAIGKSGDSVFNNITVRSGQVTGALLKATKLSANPGFYFQISFGTPQTNGAYLRNGGDTANWYPVGFFTMPAPETASHRIAASLNVISTTGSASKDLVVIVVTNLVVTPRLATDSELVAGRFDADQIAVGSNSGSFGITTGAHGISNNFYSGQMEVRVLVSGFNSANTIQNIDGLLFGVR